jgi:SAM-dependent methyltransferase
MPYPRWLKAAPVGQPTTIDWYLRGQFPAAFIRAELRSGLDVLIAGCGTGQHAIEATRRFADARVLAVDLSRTSLGYAIRKTRALGLGNVDYAQADLLQLGSLARAFDLIEAVGVLHHLRDWRLGWRTLLTLLRPGGFMHVGLYSALARGDIRSARAFMRSSRSAAMARAPTISGAAGRSS